jgi:hypothetical protein
VEVYFLLGLSLGMVIGFLLQSVIMGHSIDPIIQLLKQLRFSTENYDPNTRESDIVMREVTYWEGL